MKFFARNKKGDLSLSVNAIVIIIIAITVLGLALVFVRGMFGSVTNKISDVLDTSKIATQPTQDRPLTLTPSEPVIKATERKTISVGFLNKFSSARCVQLSLLNSAGSRLTTANYDSMSVNPIDSSSICKKLGKGDVAGWSVPITTTDTTDSVTSIITFKVNTYALPGSGNCPSTCSGTTLDEVSEDLVITVTP